MGNPEAISTEQDTAEKQKPDGEEKSSDKGEKSGKSDSKEKEEQGDSSKKEKKEGDDEDNPKKPPIYKRKGFIIGAIIAAVVIVAVLIVLWLIMRQYVSTDDAYIDGNVVTISPQVSARVLALHIDDNQFVRKGDLLVRLDPIDYQVAFEQADAQVAQAEGQLVQARAEIDSAKALVPQALAQQHAAEASLENARHDFDRYLKVDERARSRQQLENAGTTLTNARSRLEETQASVTSAKARVASAQASEKAAEGQLKVALANRKRAEVNLGYCNIFAPCEGRVTQRTVEAGNVVTIGQALFLIVDPNVWITANFKETQLAHMQPGQSVTIKVDAFSGRKWHGHVQSIQAGSGSRFSVLPAENATGNFVKIVQRVPVKIVFDHGPNTNDAPMLSPGLSVIPRVKVR